jgi:hypothetical protein
VIYALLDHFEMAHFTDLYNGAGSTEKISDQPSPAERRTRALMALDSVIGMERPREAVGDGEVWVEARNGRAERWRRL